MDKERIKTGKTEVVNTPSSTLEIPRDKRGRIRWSLLKDNPDLMKAVIETEAQAFLEAGHPMVFKGLLGAGQRYLGKIITRHYPGGISGLRATFTIPEPPKITLADKRYTDPDGISWVPYYFFRREFGFQQSTIKRMFQDIPSIIGTGSNGRNIVLYPEEAAVVRVNSFLNLPKTEEGVYVDESGIEWAAPSFFTSQFGIDRKVALRHIRGVPTIKGRAGNGHPTLLYIKTEGLARLNSFCTLPQITKGQGYVDEGGEEWVPAYLLHQRYQLSYRTIQDYLKDAPTIKGRAAGGKEVILYSHSVAERVLGELLSLPKVDKQTAKYTDPAGKSWVTLEFLQKRLGNIKALKHPQQTALRRIRGRDGNGHVTLLYAEQEASEFLIRGKLSIPRLKKLGVYTDPDGQRWVTTTYLRGKLHLTSKTLSRYVASVSTIKIKGQNDASITLYNEAQALKQAQELIELPRVNKNSEPYTDGAGEMWATINYFTQHYGLSERLILKQLAGIKTKPGRVGNNHVAELYSVNQAVEVLGRHANLPTVDRNTNRFTDIDDNTWVTARFLRDKYRFSYQTIYRVLEDGQRLRGRGLNGQEVIFYNEDEAVSKLEQINLPRVDGQTSLYIDGIGQAWGNIDFFRKNLTIGSKAILNNLKRWGVPTMRARTKYGAEVDVFVVTESVEKLRALAALPQLDKETGKYIDESGQCWVTAKFLRNNFGMPSYGVTTYLGDVTSIEGRDSHGRPTTLYSETQAIQAIKDKKGNSGRETIISPDRANEQLRRLLEE